VNVLAIFLCFFFSQAECFCSARESAGCVDALTQPQITRRLIDSLSSSSSRDSEGLACSFVPNQSAVDQIAKVLAVSLSF